MKDSALEIYLSDVLGLKSVLTPPQVEPPFRKEWESFGAHPRFLIRLPQPPRPEEKSLTQKMMAAAKVDSYLLFWGASLDLLPPELRALLRQGLYFNGREEGEERLGPLLMFSTSSLHQMLEGSPAQIQFHKKKVWTKIQSLLKEEGA
jgi:hypothetical protein